MQLGEGLAEPELLLNPKIPMCTRKLRLVWLVVGHPDIWVSIAPDPWRAMSGTRKEWTLGTVCQVI